MKHEVGLRIAIVGDEAEFRLNVGELPALEIFCDNKTDQRAADGVMVCSAALRLGHRGRKVTLGDFRC